MFFLIIKEFSGKIMAKKEKRSRREEERLMIEEMEKAMALNVPLVAEAVVGDNWAEI